VDADLAEVRVLGCLIEKQRTTPDAYPLSLNALRAACNQATNREPVVRYDERTIREALERLSRKGWVRLASGPGSRAAKYRHLLAEALSLSAAQISLLAVLMLRGPQTLGELKGRSERLHRFESLGDVERTLGDLAARELIARLPRRPGQKEDRYAQLLGDPSSTPTASALEPGFPDEPSVRTAVRENGLETRAARLEQEMSSLRAALESLRRGRGA